MDYTEIVNEPDVNYLREISLDTKGFSFCLSCASYSAG